MTYQEREAIFAKDYLTIEEVGALLGISSYTDAAKFVQKIRTKCDRLHIRGRIHVQDYIDYFGLDIERYNPSSYKIQSQD